MGRPQRATESRKKVTQSRKKGTAVLGFTAMDLDGSARVHHGIDGVGLSPRALEVRKMECTAGEEDGGGV